MEGSLGDQWRPRLTLCERLVCEMLHPRTPMGSPFGGPTISRWNDWSEISGWGPTPDASLPDVVVKICAGEVWLGAGGPVGHRHGLPSVPRDVVPGLSVFEQQKESYSCDGFEPWKSQERELGFVIYK